MTTQLSNDGLVFYIPNVDAMGTTMIQAPFLMLPG